jgi:hypothetical protein
LNHMIDQLSGHFEAVREDNTALLAMLEEKRDAGSREAGEDDKQLLTDIKENARHTRNILDKVKTDPEKSQAN